MKRVEIEQKTAEWLAWRSFKISSTDAASIMGVNPWETPLQCFERKMSGAQVPENDDMRRGTRLEPEARAWTNHQYACNFEPICVESVERPWQIASLDGFDQEAPHQVLEIKCPRRLPEAGWSTPHHYAQIQHHLSVTGSQSCVFVHYVENEWPCHYVVERNEEYIAKLEKAEKEFYDRLMNCDPPEAGDKDFPVSCSEYAHQLAKTLEEIRKRKKECEEAEEKIEKELLEEIGYSNCIAGNLKIAKISRKGNVDYAKVPELKGIDLDQYRKAPIISYRITSL